MREFVGVVDPFIFLKKDNISTVPLKRQALMFDRLAISDLSLGFMKYEETVPAFAEIRWLLECGLLFEPSFEKGVEIVNPDNDKETDALIYHALGTVSTLFGVDLNKIREAKNDNTPEVSDEELEGMLQKVYSVAEKHKDELAANAESAEFLHHVMRMTMHQTRLTSIALREVQHLDAYPILATTIQAEYESPAVKSDVVRIVIESLPIPDDSTSWEQIIEYRNDPVSQGKFLALRHWMSEVARSALTPTEVEEKLEYLLNEYQQHMKLHRMKTNIGTLESLVTTSAEVLGDLVSFKWGKAAEALFSLRNRQIVLLEGELTSPGSEVAYIIKAREVFSQ